MAKRQIHQLSFGKEFDHAHPFSDCHNPRTPRTTPLYRSLFSPHSSNITGRQWRFAAQFEAIWPLEIAFSRTTICGTKQKNRRKMFRRSYKQLSTATTLYLSVLVHLLIRCRMSPPPPPLLLAPSLLCLHQTLGFTFTFQPLLFKTTQTSNCFL
jgi:hypothetical protein